MKTVLLLAVVLAVAFARLDEDTVKRQFIEFQQKYNKVYTAGEFQNRFEIFTRNLEIAAEHQAKNPFAQFGVTIFSDLSPEEFKSMYLMKDLDMEEMKREYAKIPLKTEFGPKVTQGSSFDWNSKGVITGVYNQGSCGSCWAFSATETIESYYALAGGGLTSLSMQQVVSCDPYDSGCGGGMPARAYSYVHNAGGIDSYNAYPYTSGGGNTGGCAFNPGAVVTTVANAGAIQGEGALFQQLSSGGPVSVCVDASSWQSYQGGVLTSCGNQVDHCVQATGFTNYGAGWGSSAWNVRNSWGTGWGVNGYIFVATGADLCDIGDYGTVVAV